MQNLPVRICNKYIISGLITRFLPMYDTDRLHLRPGCPADAPMLLRAIADEDIVRNLASAP